MVFSCSSKKTNDCDGGGLMMSAIFTRGGYWLPCTQLISAKTPPM